MKPRIIIADCEEVIRDSLRYVLIEEGYYIHTAASREELIRALNLHCYDLIIAEISLINSDAKIFFDMVSSCSPSPGIILTTLYEDVRSILSLMHFGTFEYFIKPFEFELLIERVNNLLYTSSD